VRMSLQGGYLGQIVLGGSGCVKLPDVFTFSCVRPESVVNSSCEIFRGALQEFGCAIHFCHTRVIPRIRIKKIKIRIRIRNRKLKCCAGRGLPLNWAAAGKWAALGGAAELF
jgi:hypothetical protein